MLKILPFLLVVAMLPPALRAQESMGGSPQSSAVPIPARVKDTLAGLLPNPVEAGATLRGDRQFYSSELYQYIDGAADGFLAYDLVAMVHQEYRAPHADLTLDIYDMGKDLNAFGIYSAERSPSYQFLPIGVEGYANEFILNFFQAKFYVKISAFGDNGYKAPDLQHFAQAVSRRIGAKSSMPAALSILPPENLLAHSEKFVNKAPLGHDFLSPAIQGSYSLDGKTTTLLISKASDGAGAMQRISQLQDYFSKTGKVKPETAIVPAGFRGSNPYEGEVLFFARGPYVVLCLDPPLHLESFLKQVLDHLDGSNTIF